MKFSEQLRKLILKSEGFRTSPYLDVANIPTIGVGATFYQNGKRVTMKDKQLSVQQVNDLLDFHLSLFHKQILPFIPAGLKQNQVEALIAFAFGNGVTALKNSTLLKVIKNNPNDKEEIKTQFLRWVKAKKNGVLTFFQNLQNRRLDEIDLYFSDSLFSIQNLLLGVTVFFYSILTFTI